MRNKKITRILSLLMILTLIAGAVPAEAFAEVDRVFADEGSYKISSNEKRSTFEPLTKPTGDSQISVTFKHVAGGDTLDETLYYTTGGRYTRKYSSPFLGYRLNSITIDEGRGKFRITPNVKTGEVKFDLVVPTSVVGPSEPTPKGTKIVIKYNYVKNVDLASKTQIDEGIIQVNNAKSTVGVKSGDTIQAKIIDEIKSSVATFKNEQDVLKEQLAYASDIWNGLAVSVAEYFARAGALPSDIDYRAREVDEVVNSTSFLQDKEIEDFRNLIGKVELDKRILSALNMSIDSAYEDMGGHPAMSRKHRYALEGDQSKFNFKNNDGMTFQQIPFLYAINQLRTITPYSNNELSKNSLTESSIGFTIEGNPISNMLHPDNKSASGDYGTRTFLKEPMSHPGFITLLNNNGIKADRLTGTLLEHIMMINEDWAKQIVNSAFVGIRLMVDESGFRKWTPEITFNYLDAGITKENERVLTDTKLREGWAKSLVIMEYPTDYTWGYGIMGRPGASGGYYYTTVPLAPFLGVYDLQVRELETSEWDAERQSYITTFEYSLDKMPSLPNEAKEFYPILSSYISNGVIKGTTGVDVDVKAGLSWGKIEAGGDLKGRYSVEWAPNSDLAEGEKAILITTADLMTPVSLNMLKLISITPDSKALVKSIEDRGEVLRFNPDGYGLDFRYYGWYNEATHENNLAYTEKGMPAVDLYVKDVDGEYDKDKETLAVTGKVGLADGVRGLDKSKGELPVELEITWETDLYNCKCSRFC